jgi:zinc protease
MLDDMNADKALAIFKSRFSAFGHFTFVFVGNIDPATLQPLVETYLGSLPAGTRKEKWKDIGVKYASGKIEKEVLAGTEPKSRVSITMAAPDKWTLDFQRDAKILSMVLKIRLREVMREDMGGVYGVSVFASVSREPTMRRSLTVSFGCDPANVDKLRQAAFDEIAKVAKSGVTDEYLAKVSEQLRREHETNLKENDWWAEQLHDAYWYGDDFTAQTDVDAIAKRVTSANVQAAAKHFFDANHYVLGVMKPKV